MQQIKVEITGTGPLNGSLKLSDSSFTADRISPGGIFGGDGKTFPGIAFHQSLPHGILTAGIDPGCIKIRTAGRHKEIDHLFGLFNIDHAVFLRQTH